MSLTGVPSNFRTFVGVALEAAAATPTQALYIIDATSENLNGQGEPIPRKCFTGDRFTKGALPGPYSAEGDINVEITPDKLTTLWYAALTGLASTGTADPYTHVFKPGSTLLPMSIHVQRGNYLFVYPGQYVNRISLKAVIDQIFEGTFSLQGRAKEKVYDVLKNDAGVSSSSEDPFSFHQATTTLHGAASTDTNNWEVTINTGLTRHKGLGAGRAHNRAHAGKTLVEGSFDVVFDTMEEHRRWMGAASSAFPIDVTDAVQTFALQLLYTASANRKFQLDLGRAYYKTSGVAVQNEEGLVMQRCQFRSLYNAADLSDLVLTIRNGEANAAITTAGTAIP